jgi:hypothetical protein
MDGDLDALDAKNGYLPREGLLRPQPVEVPPERGLQLGRRQARPLLARGAEQEPGSVAAKH